MMTIGKQNLRNECKVCIVVLNFNGKEDTLECIESLRKLDYANYEVIVVDNGSSDGSQEALRELPGVILIENERNYGYAEGNNIGLKLALSRGAEYMLVLNNDTILHPACLTEMVSVIADDHSIGAVGAKTYFYDRPNVLQIVGGAFDWTSGKTKNIGGGEVDVGQYNKIMEVDFVNGHALLTSRTVLEQVGLFDPEYFAYNEETDWCMRARKKGFRMMYAPKAIVWHKVSRTTGQQKKAWRQYMIVRNRILFMRKNATRGQFFRFLLNFSIVQCPTMVVKGLWIRDWGSLLAIARAILWHLGLMRTATGHAREFPW